MRRFVPVRVTVRVAAAICSLGVLAAGCSITSPGSGPRTAADRASVRPGDAVAVAPRYHLWLGNWLAQGVQPDAAGSQPPHRQRMSRIGSTRCCTVTSPGLRLGRAWGVPAKTSSTMIRSSLFHYRAGSPLAQAEPFRCARTAARSRWSPSTSAPMTLTPASWARRWAVSLYMRSKDAGGQVQRPEQDPARASGRGRP